VFKIYKEKIKYYWLNAKVRRLKRQKRVVNFDDIKTAKIFSRINNPEDYNSLLEFLNLLNKKSVKFSVVCYSDNKEKLSGFIRSMDLFSKDFIFITDKDIVVRRKNTQEIIDYLINPSDVFIDLCMEDSFVADYIAGLIIAGFKVGAYNRKNNYHDLLIDIKNNRSISYLTGQIEHYLRMIKPKK